MTNTFVRRINARTALACFALFGVGVAAVSAYYQAPWLAPMAREGLPAFEEPDYISVASVQGVEEEAISEHHQDTAQWAEHSEMPPTLRALFDESDGRAMLVIKDGALLLEHYAQDVGPETRFNSFSMVKSLVGIAVLKAVDDKTIETLDAPLSTWLPEIENPSLGQTTLRQLLTMRSGLLFENEGEKALAGPGEKDLEKTAFNPLGPMAELHYSGISKLLPNLKGSGNHERFDYQNANTALLGLVLERAEGRPLEEIISENIWRPAGANAAHWRMYPDERRVTAYCCLYATARDWLKIGTYILNNGTQEEPLLSKEAFAAFLGQDLSDQDRHTGVYGYHVRQDILDREDAPLSGPFTYFIGRGGQALYLMPTENLVIVRFGRKHQLLHSTLYAASELWLKEETAVSS